MPFVRIDHPVGADAQAIGGGVHRALVRSTCLRTISSKSFGPDRVGFAPSIAASSTSTSLTKASTSAKASLDAGEVLAVLTAVPICCGSDGC
jgi:hypothetical protein